MAAWRDRFVTVDGRRIHYFDEGQGPALILLHSGGGSLHEFEHVLDPLKQRFRVLAWDMPGHGDSEPILTHWTIEDYAAIFAGFVDALSLDRFSLLGVSIGGYIGMAFAAEHADRLDRLILTEAPLRSAQWYEQNWTMFEATCAIPETPYEVLKTRLHKLTPELHQRWNIDRNKAGSWTIVDLAWAVRAFDAGGAFGGLPIAPNVMVGGAGPTVGDIDRMRGLQPAAAFTVIEGCGHFPMLDDPPAFARAVEQAMAA